MFQIQDPFQVLIRLCQFVNTHAWPTLQLLCLSTELIETKTEGYKQVLLLKYRPVIQNYR